MSTQTTMTAVRVCRCESTAPTCPILSLFIALTGDSPSQSKYKTRYTFKIMTLSVENSSQGYVVGCNCCEAAPLWLFWRRRAQLSCTPAEGGSTGRRYAAQRTPFRPGLPRLTLDNGISLAILRPANSMSLSKTGVGPFSTSSPRRSGRSTAVCESPHVRTVTQGCLYLPPPTSALCVVLA